MMVGFDSALGVALLLRIFCNLESFSRSCLASLLPLKLKVDFLILEGRVGDGRLEFEMGCVGEVGAGGGTGLVY
jgi:hypothetical protein